MISRYELKFEISPQQRQEILAAAGDALAADPHGESGRYRVISHYFDSPDLACYWRKVDGEAIRRKIRLRYYSSEQALDFPELAFLEIKRRVNSAIYKDRLPIAAEGVRAILADSRELGRVDEFVLGRRREFAPAIGELVRLSRSPGLLPTVVISYVREAWMGAVDARLRLTFDSLCMAHPATDQPPPQLDHGASILPATRLLMEIKIDNAIPRWLRDIVVRQRVRQVRFSKYAVGIEALGLATVRRHSASLPSREPPIESDVRDEPTEAECFEPSLATR